MVKSYGTALDLDYQAVLKAARRMAAGLGNDELTSWKAPASVARMIGEPAYQLYARPHTSYEYKARERFEGQVRRALGVLTDEGVLLKAGAGQRGPDGHFGRGRDARYWTAAGWTAAELHRVTELEDAAVLRARWEAVYDRLAAAGLEPGCNAAYHRHYGTDPDPVRGCPLKLEPEQWEILLGMREAPGGMTFIGPPEVRHADH